MSKGFIVSDLIITIKNANRAFHYFKRYISYLCFTLDRFNIFASSALQWFILVEFNFVLIKQMSKFFHTICMEPI